MIEETRFYDPNEQIGDEKEFSLRPKTLADFIGQANLRRNLSVFIEAAKKRDESLEHVLFYGPPGLGKTSLANIIASEMQGQIKITSGPAIERPGDLAAILTNLNKGDILFIDEIHRLNRSVEEVLYPAMEDFELDIVIGKGPAARSIRLNLERFTLVGATTRVGSLSAPLRDRFGIIEKFDYYTPAELAQIVERSSLLLETPINSESALMIAESSRGTPRISNRILKRVRDWSQVYSDGSISVEDVRTSLEALGIDPTGIDQNDRLYLDTLVKKFSGGPVGVDTLAASMSEESETLEDVIEPYLLQKGYLDRTAKGRMATDLAYEYLGIQRQQHNNQQSTLF
ncbi:MAG: Holliday junction branch migration DNA helicase RuvB [Candidatus Margulisiibacteriota bacterium]|nr:Holliday junction branch migration DNA helicase RuvB [Candidatus Margulisiibacteriota bacterium]